VIKNGYFYNYLKYYTAKLSTDSNQCFLLVYKMLYRFSIITLYLAFLGAALFSTLMSRDKNRETSLQKPSIHENGSLKRGKRYVIIIHSIFKFYYESLIDLFSIKTPIHTQYYCQSWRLIVNGRFWRSCQFIDEHLRSQINIDVLTILLMSILRLSIKLTIKQCNSHYLHIFNKYKHTLKTQVADRG